MDGSPRSTDLSRSDDSAVHFRADRRKRRYLYDTFITPYGRDQETVALPQALLPSRVDLRWPPYHPGWRSQVSSQTVGGGYRHPQELGYPERLGRVGYFDA